jgi:hypothetical protein
MSDDEKLFWFTIVSCSGCYSQLSLCYRLTVVQGIGWVRSGSSVCYSANSIVCRKKQTYYTLTLTVDFPYDQDTVHLAHCYPFTWTDQQNHIRALKKVRLGQACGWLQHGPGQG